jgi:hypothetical protein
MARTALRWGLREAAAKAGIATSTLQVIEAGDGPAEISPGLEATRHHRESVRQQALHALWGAFTGAGIVFVEGNSPNSTGAIYEIRRRK